MDSRFIFLAVFRCQVSLPYGWPRCMLCWMASCSAIVCGWFTLASQLRPSGAGLSASSERSSAVPCKRRKRLPNRHSVCVRRQFRPQRIPLHVARYGQQVLILFDGERLEAPLIDVPHAQGVVVDVVTHGVREREHGGNTT